MKDKITINIGTDHSYDCKADVIGRAGEGFVTQFVINVPEKLRTWSLYLDFEKPNGETFRTTKLTIKDGVANYYVPHFVLTDSGEIKAQAVFIDETGGTWKSAQKIYTNLKSINVTEDVDGYIIPTGTIEIDDNNTYDVKKYAYARVNVNNGTSDAEVTAGDVVNGLSFYGKDGKDYGTMQMASTNRFKNIVIEKSSEQELAINYYADENLYIPNTADSTRMGTIALVQEEAFLPSNIKKGVTLFGLNGTYEGESGGGEKNEPNLAGITVTATEDYQNILASDEGCDGFDEVIVNPRSPLPIVVSSKEQMDALLTNGTVGGVYKYTGTTGTYENGALYVLENE